LNVEAMLRDIRDAALKAALIGLFLLTGSLGVQADDAGNEGEAKAVVDALHNSLYATAASDLSFDERYDEIAAVVVRSHDFSFISRFVLRRAWANLDSTQRNRFISAFERLSIANYASRFAELEDQSIIITDVQAVGADGKRVQVDAQLRSGDLQVMLSYTLKAGEGDWMIVNVVADGVSDLALRRTEYSRKLKETGFEGLLNHIDGQIAKLQ